MIFCHILCKIFSLLASLFVVWVVSGWLFVCLSVCLFARLFFLFGCLLAWFVEHKQ